MWQAMWLVKPQEKGELLHGAAAGLVLTTLLLSGGGLAPSCALPEGTESQREVLLSPEPVAGVWVGSCHVGLRQLLAKRWSGHAAAAEVKTTPPHPKIKNKNKISLSIVSIDEHVLYFNVSQEKMYMGKAAFLYFP